MRADGRGAAAVPVGVLELLRPKLLSKIHRAVQGNRSLAKFVFLAGAITIFWGLIFGAIYRMLIQFRSAAGIGDLLAGKLLGLALLSFLMILLLSNVITALSTFFLSRDLDLLLSSPTDPIHLYWARLTETTINSSWMVLLLLIPILGAYGVMYGAGPRFYLLALAVVLPLLLLPAVGGVAFTLALVNLFPARRTRDLLALIGLFAAAGVVLLVRLLQPERMVRPDEARSVVEFMATMQTPTSPWLPSEWAAGALIGWLNGRFDPFPAFLLLTTAAAFLVLGGWLHLRFYPTGYSRAQEGAEFRGTRVRIRGWEKLLAPFDLTTQQLVAKELRVFFRDATQWSQLILLGVLVVVYVYNIRVLPLSTASELSFLLVNLIAFLNLALAGFVVASIAARFVFPAMSLEGRMTWLLRSSPLDPRKLLWVKYWVGTLPILVVALPLILATNLILDVAPFLLVLSTITMVGITLTFTAMALAFGALYPNYQTENPAEIPTSFGGFLFMMSAIVYLAAIIVMEGWPVYLFLLARFRGLPIEGAELLAMGVGCGGALLLTVSILVRAARAAEREVRRTENFAGEGAS